MPATVDESHDRHDWTLVGHTVAQLCADARSCRIQTWSLDSSLEIRVGVPLRLTLADGTARTIDPEASEELAPLLTLIGREIRRLTVTRVGTLSVALSDGSVLDVSAHPHAEAFHVSGGGALEGLMYKAVPGGGVPWEQ
jgi:Family of unknown function (DUF6188)